MSEWRRRLAKNVKTRREARGYTQAGLAQLIGSNQEYIRLPAVLVFGGSTKAAPAGMAVPTSA
jgi:hypothetical protein